MNPLTRFVAPALLALSLAGSLLPAAMPAQAAGLPDLDVTKCSIIPFQYYGEIGYAFDIEIINEGTAPTGQFRYAVQPVTSYYPNNLFFGQVGDEVRVEHNVSNLNPGQKRSIFYTVTKRVVDQKLWGVFLDIKGQVAESQENDNFCSAFVNNT